MKDSKPVTVAEVLKWQSATHSALQPHAHVPFDRLLATAQAAAEADSLRAQLEEARKSFADFQELKRNKCPTHAGARVACRQCHDSLKQHLTAAQGDVAVLREALEKHGCEDQQRGAAAGGHDGGPCTVETPMDLCWVCATLASTRATAAAHDERVRREALEEAADHAEDFTCPNCGHDTARELAMEIRALAHPTREPKP